MSSILFTEERLQLAVKEIANKINEGHLISDELNPVFICLLNGAYVFFADLTREIKFNFQVDFLRAKSYVGQTSGDLSITKDIELPILHRKVYLIDDIYDSGQTINKVTKHLLQYLPEEIIPVVLFKKQFVETPKNLIYGIELQDESFLVGYGLDNSSGYQRNLKYILGEQGQD
jgi:hypoxanthine phosphoribosyltransferase